MSPVGGRATEPKWPSRSESRYAVAAPWSQIPSCDPPRSGHDGNFSSWQKSQIVIDALWCIMMHWVSNTERSVLIVCYRCYSKIQWRPRNPDRFVVDTSWYSILLNVCMFFFSRSRKGAGDAEHGFELRAPSCLGDLGQKRALRPLRDGEQVKP